MKKFLPSLLFLILASLTSFAQTPSPTAATPPKPADESDVVKISTTLIQVDATVTDKNGNIVTDLKPEDFEIYENGQKQPITNFSFVSAPSETISAAPTAPTSKNSAASNVPAPPVALRPEQVRRTIALVVDDLSLSFESTHFVREALKKFVETQMRDGDLVAIIRTGGGIGALQQFTSDRRQLEAAIDKIRWNPAGNGKIGAFEPIEATPLEQAKASGIPVTDEQLAQEKNQNQRFKDFQGSVFASGTLGALNFIIKGMRELPGRKSVMLMSDGFKLFTQDESGFKESSIILDALKRLTDLANRSSVVIYTMDARGLQTLSLTAADDTSQLTGSQIEEKLSDNKNELFDTQDGLIYLAQQTGGTALINNNDLNGGIRKMLNDQKGYYLIGYTPDTETFDPQKRRFNKLTVKVKRPDLKVRYRSGFFGLTDDETDRPAKQTPQQQITAALTSPFAENGIELRLNTLFGNDLKNGEYMRSFLQVGAKDLKFTDEADGTHKATFDVLAVSFGENGLVADQIAKNYTITLKENAYQDFLRDGFVYNFMFPVKKPGAYQMRVAIRDEGSGKIGSANQFIEAPDLKKGKLTLSGIVLENLTFKEYQDLQTSAASAANPAPPTKSSMQTDTSLRKFKRGTVLRYGFEIYNAKLGGAQKPQLSMQTRVFRDGKLLFEGKPIPVNLEGQKDWQKISSMGALSLGTEMAAGDYVLQIVVNDAATNDKNRIASQWVQFEITE
ncbi:MAG: VWA domain-containing protein [Pyrinomonadaceae bacterium]